MEETEARARKIIEIRSLLKERERARKGGDFGKSDSMRERLERDFHIEIIDQKDGPSGWKFKDGSSNKIPPGVNIPEMPVSKSEDKEKKGKKRQREGENDEEVSANEPVSAVSKKKKVSAESSTPKKSEKAELSAKGSDSSKL